MVTILTVANPGEPAPSPPPLKRLKCSKLKFFSQFFKKCNIIMNFPSFYFTFFKKWQPLSPNQLILKKS